MRRPEQVMQQKIVKWINANICKSVDWFHVPSNPKNKLMGAILKAMGAKSGISDLVFCWERNWGFLELKVDSKPSADQLKFLGRMSQRGYYTAVAYSYDEAIETLERWGVPKVEGERLTDEEAKELCGF